MPLPVVRQPSPLTQSYEGMGQFPRSNPTILLHQNYSKQNQKTPEQVFLQDNLHD